MNKSAIARVMAWIKMQPANRIQMVNIFTDLNKMASLQALGMDRDDAASDAHLNPYIVEWDVAKDDCGTAFCIAGATLVVERPTLGDYDSSISAAARVLGLDEDTANELFLRNLACTRDDAIARLTHLYWHGSFAGYNWEGETGYEPE